MVMNEEEFQNDENTEMMISEDSSYSGGEEDQNEEILPSNSGEEDLEDEEINEDWLHIKETLHGEEPVYAIDVNPADPSIFATGGGDDRAVLARVDGITVSVIAELSGHSDTVDRLRFSPDGQYLATGGMDGTVIVWDGRTGEMQASFAGLDGEVGWLAWHPSQKNVLAAGSLGDGVVWQWNVERQECISVLRANSQRSLAGQYSLNGKFLVTTDVGRVFVWTATEPASSKQALSYAFPDAQEMDIVSLAINQGSTMALAGCSSGTLYMLNLLRHESRTVPSRHEEGSSIEWVGFAPGRLPFMMSAGLDGAFQVYEQHDLSLRSRTILPPFGSSEDREEGDSLEPNGITCAALMSGPDPFVVTGSINGTMAMWDIRSGIRVASLGNAHRVPCLGLAHLPSPINVLFGVFDDGRLLGLALNQLEQQQH